MALLLIAPEKYPLRAPGLHKHAASSFNVFCDKTTKRCFFLIKMFIKNTMLQQNKKSPEVNASDESKQQVTGSCHKVSDQ